MSTDMGILDTKRPEFDPLLTDIARYASEFSIESEDAYETARYCLMDTLGCGLLALKFPQCTKLLGPVVPGASMPYLGAKCQELRINLTQSVPLLTWVRWYDGLILTTHG